MNKDVLIDVPMPIVTPRLIIRPPQEGDGQMMHDAKVESYDELLKWMIWIDDKKENLSAEIDEIMCREKSADFILRKDLRLHAFDRKTDKFIGASGLHDLDWRVKTFTTGYWVRSSETNKGYATEIATAIVHYAFKVLEAHRVSIFYDEGNEASQRVIEKVGYEKEGVFKQASKMNNGDFVDRHSYGLLSLDKVPEMDIKWGVK